MQLMIWKSFQHFRLSKFYTVRDAMESVCGSLYFFNWRAPYSSKAYSQDNILNLVSIPRFALAAVA